MTQGLALQSQISRDSLYWLLLAQFALILPFGGRLPGWIFAACLLCGFWRIQIYRNKLSYASGLTRVLLIITAFIGISYSFIDNMGLDAVVAFLILIFFLKLLETRRARDMYVTIFLGYFVAATPLLYSQSMLAVLYAILCHLLLSVSLLALHHRHLHRVGAGLVRTTGLLLQGAPIVLVLFLLFPRVGPLWMAPQPGSGRSVGVSDSVSLGSFGRLALSDEVAFRVDFDGVIPPPERLYWRGLVFEEFDGATWRVGKESLENMAAADWSVERRGEALSYEVVLEPTNQAWLFALALADPADVELIATAGHTLRLAEPPRGRYQYRVRSSDYMALQVGLPPEVAERNLGLPERANPRSRLMGEQLRTRYQSPELIAAAVLELFREQDFYYSLEPRHYAENSIDGFLLEDKRGYCEHYAAAFVFLMRAAGVPARMVGGYLGGEVNPFDDYLAVRQMDAHAWAEIWLEGRGWLRYDPTAQVAPERIYQGVDALMMQRRDLQSANLLGVGRYRELAWMKSALLWWDAVNYGWARWFLNYDRATQLSWMSNWFGRGDMAVLLRVFAVSLCAVIAMLLLWMCRGALVRGRGPAQLAALIFSRLLGNLGSARQPSESMIAYCARVAEQHPSLAPTLSEFSAVWSALTYADLRYHRGRRILLHLLLIRLAAQILGLRMTGLKRLVLRRA